MQMICRRRATAASALPTASAVAPPMPASTSSNRYASTGSDSARTRFTASRTRDSSPPEAMRESGRSSSPGLGLSRSSAVSSPRGPIPAMAPSPAASKRTEISLRAIPSAESSCATALLKAPAADRRFSEIFSASARAAAASRWTSASRRAGAELLRRRQHPPLLREPLVLARVRRGLFQLVELELEPIRPLRPLRFVRIELGAQPLCPGERGEGLGEVRAQLAELRVRIEEIEVERRIEQADVLVLAGDVQQASRRGLQLGGSGESTIDPGTAAPLALHGAAHHQLASSRGQPQALEPCVAGGGVAGAEQRLDFCLLRPCADRVGLRASSQHQVQRIDQDALARTGLAGEDVEPGLEVHLELVDDGKRPHPQQLQHAGQNSRRVRHRWYASDDVRAGRSAPPGDPRAREPRDPRSPARWPAAALARARDPASGQHPVARRNRRTATPRPR